MNSLLELINSLGYHLNTPVNLVITIGEDAESEDVSEMVNNFKDNVKELDDNIFIEAVEDINEVLDIKELDRLLSKKDYSKEEANKVKEMIEISSEIISNKLQDKIEILEELSGRFHI